MGVRTRSLIKVGLWSLLTLAVGALLSLVLVSYHYNKDLPQDLTALQNYDPDELSQVYTDDNQVIGEFYIQRRVVVPLEDIPKVVVDAFVASEDSRFFKHHGVDYIGIFRALVKNLSAGRVVQGASTLTQQIARDFFLKRERTLGRKVKEAILAFRIEWELSKEQILYLYLNQIYLGHGAYGVEAASQNYFRKNVREIELPEAAMLAGLPKAPSYYSPYTNFSGAKERQSYVLDRMLEEGYVSEREAEWARDLDLRIVSREDLNYTTAPYLVEHVRRYIRAKYGSDHVYREGLKVYTGLDVFTQRAAQEAVRNGLKEIDRSQGYRGAKRHLMAHEIEGFLKQQEVKLREQKLGKKPRRHARLKLEMGEDYQAVVVSTLGKIQLRIGPFKAVLDEEASKWATKVLLKDGSTVTRPLKETLRVGDVVDVHTVKGDRGRYGVVLDQEPLIEGALVAIDPSNGYVRAMVGGYDYARSEFNRAVQARRQPGSAFKPIIYTAAMDHGFTEMSIVVDSPVSFRLAGRRTWTPRNYKNQYTGPQTLRTALAKSINTIAVKLTDRLGVKRVIAYARQMGIRSPLAENMSLALGSSGVSLLELTQAYTVFPAGGRRAEPIFIKRIEDRHGNVLEDNTTPPLPLAPSPRQGDGETGGQGEKAGRPLSPSGSGREGGEEDEAFRDLPPVYAISPQTAYIMTDMLKNVVQNGTGQRVKALNRPAAGKTGTTNRYTDAWYMGFTPEIVAGVWVGFDDRRPIGKDATGGRLASPIWLAFASKALDGKPVQDFAVPEGIGFMATGAGSGGTAQGKVLIPFKRGRTIAKGTESGKAETGLTSAGVTLTADGQAVDDEAGKANGVIDSEAR